MALCRRVREEITKARLGSVADICAEVPHEKMPLTVRGVLMHQVWHWTYHTGQAGLLRRLAGARYRWRFAERL